MSPALLSWAQTSPATLARNGYTVALHNRSVEKTDALLAEHGADGDFIRTESLQELVDSLESPRRILIMVKAGAPVDAVIEQLIPHAR